MKFARHVVDKTGHRCAHRIKHRRPACPTKHIDGAERRTKFRRDPLLDPEMVNRRVALASKQMHLDADKHFVMPVKAVADALVCQGNFRNQCKIATPHAGHPGGQRPVVELVRRARKSRRIQLGVSGARGVEPRVRFNGLDKGGDDLRCHRSGFRHHSLAVGDFRREDCQVHIAAVQAVPLWQVTDSGTDADLIMQVVNHLVGDGVVKNAAGRTDHEMILEAGIRHHGREAVNTGAAFKRGKIQRILKRHHPRLLLHRRINNDSATSGLGKPHAGSVASGGTENKTGEGQHQHGRQPDQVKPAPPFKPCI